jgi:deoxyribonucleoside regulator
VQGGVEESRLFLLGRVAELYYEQDLSQEEVAAELHLSRPKVSRLLKEAREAGIVQIVVRSPIAFNNRLEAALKRAFPCLKKVLVVAAAPDSPAAASQARLQRDVARAAAEHIHRVVTDGAIVGVAWGSTMGQIVQHLMPKQVRGVVVVQIKGSSSLVSRDNNAQEVARRFGQAYDARVYYLQVPTVVDTVAVKQALLANRETAEVLELGRRANVVVFSIGLTETDSVLVESGYLTEAQVAELKESGVVGNIIAHHYDLAGAISAPELDERTIGLPLAEFGTREHAIGVVIGPHKARATLGALRGHHLNELILDEATAGAVLALHEGSI